MDIMEALYGEEYRLARVLNAVLEVRQLYCHGMSEATRAELNDLCDVLRAEISQINRRIDAEIVKTGRG